MLRRVLAVSAGVIGGSAVIWLLEMFGYMMFPGPEGMDTADPEAMRQLMKEVPVAAFVVILLAYAAGSFAGGWIALAIGEKMKDAMITGVVLLGFGIVNLMLVPHPLWFTLISVLLYLPFAYLGGKAKWGRRMIRNNKL